MKLTIFQPWSEFVMKGSLPEEILSNLIELTDVITQDNEKQSKNNDLAGEIEDEWAIDVHLLSNIKFTPFLFQLIEEYIRLTTLQSRPTNTSQERTDKEFIKNEKIFWKKRKIKEAWFNNQKDNEYNPIHAHGGILSGILYLKIPEYLPARKNNVSDGAIMFVGSLTPNDGLFTSPHFSILPKVGDIFLFPATLRHLVYPFRTSNGKEIRRSMSFNIS